MYTFLGGLLALLLGYLFYGKLVDRIFGVGDRPMPAVTQPDGVDFVPLPTWRVVLIQLLNIAGVGPILGAVMGAYYGPAAFIWIIFGCIFAGAVHDFSLGLISARQRGASLSEIIGDNLGNPARHIMRVFMLIFLLLVGAVFVYTPAQVLREMFTNGWTPGARQIFYIAVIAVIIVYYALATVFPIDKLIGKLYPIFGLMLFVNEIGLTGAIFLNGEIANVPEFAFRNLHPSSGSAMTAMIFPFLFVTIACGAVSGFHSTQSPLMARCIKTERDARKAFYGAMILEGVIAMIWAAVAMAHFTKNGDMSTLVSAGSAPVVVTKASLAMLGYVGGIIVLFGVVICPITSGDTAFRSARLMLAEIFHFDQRPMKNRYLLGLPLIVAGIGIVWFATSDAAYFQVIWRYFAWSNQTLAAIGLWAASVYLMRDGRNYWITCLPALLMTAVSVSYILCASEGFGAVMTRALGEYAYTVGVSAGAATAFIALGVFLSKARKKALV